ncbi:hypothetical protein Agub_g1676 [Astrephomene gubernaculifera]|uniref:Protein kinase domain-containing protein n=1 Tax=Astrephomene gubernaculifera TaxID=47775 RepID=A0AAD3DFR8_9CHLO|nr:hypothetical protein Agub_g1676 [Astrephomene gubernaculifera]
MLSRRKSIEDSDAPANKGKTQNILLKYSTANAFVNRLSKASFARSRIDGASSAPSASYWDVHRSPGSSSATPLPPDSDPAAAFLDTMPPATPPVRGPYYGMYAEYDEVMDVLHTGVVADGSSRRLLAHVGREQVVHVAHLGLGACCSVDLVAVHCTDGSRVLAAAKSCYLPPSDPRMRASLREAELLRRCADCPFIMQLLVVLQDQPGEATGRPLQHQQTWQPSTGGASSWGVYGTGSSTAGSDGTVPGPMPRCMSELRAAPDAWLGRSATMGGGVGYGGADSGVELSGQSQSAGGGIVASMAGSVAYQAWAQWRGGGGGAEELERQLWQRLAAASASYSGGGGRGDDGGGFGLLQDVVEVRGSGTGGAGCSSWDCGGGGVFSLHSTLLDSGCSNSMAAAAAAHGHGGGGGWQHCGYPEGSYHTGQGYTETTPPGTPRRSSCMRRRGSLEIIDMYGGCVGICGGDASSAGGGIPASQPSAPASSRPEAPVMCTLLLGWARCGDLRRLVQVLLGRSPAHRPQKHHSAAEPGHSSLPPLMNEDAARFYMGCMVLALEHLHVRLHTVHRDLKLANLLLLSSGYVVVGDLGTAVDLSTVPGGRLSSRVGSPGHMAPECRDRDEAGYDTSADMWSLGACLFALLTGHLPAGTAGPPGRSWSPPLSRSWSRELQDLLLRLLAWAPSQRPTVGELLRDPWFRGFNWAALRAQKMPAPSSTPWRELLWWPKETKQAL